ncbi:MAG: alanine racemase [Acutalibacteraceae bacterium]|nr:alanine racemase [Acutalibacteraceae bacterium]
MAFLHRTWAEIDVSALVHNYNVIKNSADPAKLMCVVKADAYGHETEIVLPALISAGADCFAVSNIDEALELRSQGVSFPVLILGYTPPEAAKKLSENGIIQTVYDKDYAVKLNHYAKESNVTVKVHIKLDTGMGRIGFNCRNEKLSGVNDVNEILDLSNLLFDGIFTHFSSADRSGDEDGKYTALQYERFVKATEIIKENCNTITTVHCCNSAGLLYEKDKHSSLCRPGIILYGLSPDKDMKYEEKLIPVMTVKSVVSQVKEVDAHTYISYGRTFKSNEKMKLATVSVGYADGYPRALSNKGQVIINGIRCNIVGRVCMDQMVVDVSHLDGVQMGDEVILLGKDLPVDEIAQLCGTINYEIVCGISKRVPRIKV